MRFTLLLLLTSATLALGASGETVVLRGAAQGTTYHVKLVAPAKGLDRQELRADVERVLAEIDRKMSTYRSDSEISRFNRAAPGEWFAVSAATADVVTAANEISEKTGGAMDVTVGPLVRVWHFGPEENTGGKSVKTNKAPSPYPLPKGEGEFTPPSEEELEAVRQRVGYKLLEVRAKLPALKKAVDGLEVDLSSIAPGYTIDQLSELLRRRGIKDFMIELGGEVRAAGEREDGTPWRVAIERPVLKKREMEAAVPLVNAALATAGGTHKFFEYGGRRYSHIIDPATARPVEHALASVSVAADTCLEADGWDTPLTVLGPERGMECAERNGIAAMFISPADDGDRADKVLTTAAWRKRFGEPGK